MGIDSATCAAITEGTAKDLAMVRRYKIHTLSVAGTRSTVSRADNGKFYDSYAEALKQASQWTSKDGGKEIVIYKAICIVRPSCPPVEVVELPE